MGISERKMREKEVRKKAIFDAAEKLFFARPYDAVSMDDIAEALELSKPTIYLYFQDKESLYLSIVERGYRILADMMYESVKNLDNGIEKLAAIGMSYHTFVITYPDYDRVLSTYRSGRFETLDQEKSEALCSVHRVLQEISTLNDDAIQAGIKDGTIRSDIDPVVLSILLSTFSTSVHNLNSWDMKRLESQGFSKEQFADEFINMMYNMMENPDHLVQRRTNRRKTGR
ncbi:TetR/AcrR family transcriptional regulator [Methanospirillum lacunae]|uniref:TetR/AcrR family transcriptional regulator n=1 Tax=Methanospirillum lacunae TaxID=668570 RepID=A0A2V2MX84_9EURY|nr:TetR/AcrR family transcriptional regulator [Methanospirillum lacunae]PWR72522.1 TetR/AcrR family transcriptional regulator [Methanospirillum lacunae]